MLNFDTALDDVVVKLRVSSLALQSWGLVDEMVDGQNPAKRRAMKEAKLHLKKVGAQRGETWRVTIADEVTCERVGN